MKIYSKQILEQLRQNSPSTPATTSGISTQNGNLSINGNLKVNGYIYSSKSVLAEDDITPITSVNERALDLIQREGNQLVLQFDNGQRETLDLGDES